MGVEKEKKQDNLLITVLILSYCSPDLYAAINSVLKQDYAYIQCILVDDGTPDFSKDDVQAYIESHRNSNIDDYIVIQNLENYGTVRSVNIGLNHFKGNYLFILAGDDVFSDSSVLREWTDAFQENKSLVMTAYRDVYDKTLTHYLGRMPTESQVQKIRNLTSSELFEEIAKENFIFGCCTAFSRYYFEQYGYYNERYRLIEDHSMILRLLRQGVTIAFFDKTVVYYRGGGSSSAIRYNKDYERDMDLIYEFEVIPYVKNKKHIQKVHRKWKAKQRLAQDFNIRLSRTKKNPFHVLFLRVWFHAHYPIASLRGLLANPAKLKKMFRNI